MKPDGGERTLVDICTTGVIFFINVNLKLFINSKINTGRWLLPVLATFCGY